MAFVPHRGPLVEGDFRAVTSIWDRNVEKQDNCGLASEDNVNPMDTVLFIRTSWKNLS